MRRLKKFFRKQQKNQRKSSKNITIKLICYFSYFYLFFLKIFSIYSLAQALVEKETLDLDHILEILGERPFPIKENFKAYLESKKIAKVAV